MSRVVHAFTTKVPVWSPYVTPVDLATATVETRKPTFFRPSGGGYSRLLLPAWGDGHIAMLIGAVSQEAGGP